MTRNFIKYLILLTFIFTELLVFLGCENNSENNTAASYSETSLISNQEINDLLALREEEKLARDVYLYAYDKYNLRIFKSISNSEQSHMDQVLIILRNYNLNDSANISFGSFNNSTFQNLYNDLTSKVNNSPQDALAVGITIEKMDIADIERFIQHADKPDILSMYNRLLSGSKNHLQAFSAQL